MRVKALTIAVYGCCLWLMLTTCSCGLVTINGTTQGLTSYYKKSKKTCGELFASPGINQQVCDTTHTNKLVIGNGKTLRQCITGQPKTLVYLWSPKCKSKYCVSLDLLQQQCHADSVALIVVAEYYDCRLMQRTYQLKHPIVGIDIKHYKSNLTSTYIQRFLCDLTQVKAFPKGQGRYFYFENGRFVRNVKEINSLKSAYITE